MRYWVGFVCVLAVVALPLSVEAQEGERSSASSQPATEEPVLQLELGDEGVEVTPGPPRTPEGYTLEEMQARARRAKGGCAATGGLVALGLGLLIGGVVHETSEYEDAATK